LNSLRRLYWTIFLAVNMRGQSRYPFRPRASIEADRDRAVRRMAKIAVRQVPFYRRAFAASGLRLEDIRGASDLARLPLIDANTLRDGPADFVADNADLPSCLVLKTSGSSGQSREIPIDAAALFRNAAQGERERTMMTAAIGRRYGYREAVIVLNPSLTESSTPRLQRFLRENAFLPRGAAVERLYIDAAEPPQKYLPRLDEFRPEIIQAYGSSIDELFEYVTSSGALRHTPRAVYFHSDGISPRTRARLGELGIAVCSTYEACEALKIGFECEAHAGYHVNIDTYPVRIVDEHGHDVEPGDAGRVVISKLSNRAMVLLNYDLGDRARWLVGPCACGRTLPRLELLEGSPLKPLMLPSGRVINPSELYLVFLGEPMLREHQIVQLGPQRFRVALVIPEESQRSACRERVGRAFAALFGGEAVVEVVCVDQIPLSPGGKKRSFIPMGES